MTVANYLTFARLLLSPCFLIVYIAHDAIGISSFFLPYVLLFLLGMSELSDAVDGYIARKYNQVTDLGKVLDPMADSISRTAVFLAFTQGPVNLPIFLIFIFLYRDSTMSTLRMICALKGYALAASLNGKIKAIIQSLAAFSIILLMIPHSMGLLETASLQQLSLWIVSLAAIYTVYSAIEYMVINKRYLAAWRSGES